MTFMAADEQAPAIETLDLAGNGDLPQVTAAADVASESASATAMASSVPVASGIPAISSSAEHALRDAAPAREIIYRHSVAVRLTHWVNALLLAWLLMSGLRIFNYHPALYWGNDGHRGMPSVFSIQALEDIDTDEPVGVMSIAGKNFITTGWLGVTNGDDGEPVGGAFPNWITLPGGPGLALARDWHFALAWLFVINGALYFMFGLFNGHFRRDLLPGTAELAPKHVLQDIWNHLRLRRPRGAAARRYNVLQKLAYILVVFVLLPLMVATGLTMSPAVTAAMPFLFDLFGGRQSARTIHFIVANLLVLFVLVHIIQVVLAGPFNEMRSMITGRFAIRPALPGEGK
jgi:thiosulfate reductase cytochrome b subunit